MARNRIYIDRTPDEVFDFLERIEGYPSWIPGAKRVPEVEGSWPRPGAEYRHVIGWGPFEASDRGTVVRYERPHRISLDVGIPFFGVAEVDIDVESSGGGSLVTLEERMDVGHASVRSLFEPGLHVRNADALRRLKALVEDVRGGPMVTARALVPPPHWLQDPGAASILHRAETCLPRGRDQGRPPRDPGCFLVLRRPLMDHRSAFRPQDPHGAQAPSGGGLLQLRR